MADGADAGYVWFWQMMGCGRRWLWKMGCGRRWLWQMMEKNISQNNNPGGSNTGPKHTKAWELPAELAGSFVNNMLQ